MLVLFFLLSILEDVGYMSRVAFIMDRIFRKFGLSGKSFIPVSYTHLVHPYAGGHSGYPDHLDPYRYAPL